jgi:hypothetical protein
MTKLVMTLILTMIVSLPIVRAGEADQYTGKQEPLADSLHELNLMANDYLAIALDELSQVKCSQSKDAEMVLYKKLQKYFANHSKGKLIKDIFYKEALFTRRIALKESIYKKWKIGNGYLMGRKKAATSPLALTPLLQLGREQVGADKLEHMFGMGFIYFKKHYLKGKKLHKVLKHGILREKTSLGGNILATGVFSYADLSANFNGMRFWNHMLQKRKDVMGQNLGPYVKCENERWVATENRIDFGKYIDASMDESINCSKFATKNGIRKYKKSLKRLSEKDGVEYSCPMSVAKLQKSYDKYNIIISGKYPLSHWIINRDSVMKVSYFNEF